MAQVKFLKRNAAGEAQQHDSTADDLTFATLTTSGDATIGGSLTVNGTLTSINTTNLNISDASVVLRKGAAAAGDGGLWMRQAAGPGAGSGKGLLYESTSNELRIGAADIGTDAAPTNPGDIDSDAAAATYLQVRTEGVHVGGSTASNRSRSGTASFHSGTGAGSLDRTLLLNATTGRFELNDDLTLSGNLYLPASGAVDFGAGEVTATHASATLTFSGAAAVNYVFGPAGSVLRPVAPGGSDLGTSSVGWGDYYAATGKKLDFGAGNLTVTHSSGTLTLGPSTGPITIRRAAAAATTSGATTNVEGSLGGSSGASVPGGVGGGIVLLAGDGGANASDTAGSAPGTGGTLSLRGGTGGLGADNVTNDYAGAAGGPVSILGGIGGDGAGTTNPGAGGSTTVAGGLGGSFGTGNAVGGNLTLRGGAGTGSGANGDLQLGLTNTTNVDVGTAANGLRLVTSTGILSPRTNDGVALGSGTLSFSDLFLATGAVINYGNGNYTITHSTGLLTFSNAATFSGLVTANLGLTVTGAALTLTTQALTQTGAVGSTWGSGTHNFTAGTLNVPASTAFQVGGVALEASFTGANVKALLAGPTSLADALHTHDGVGGASLTVTAGATAVPAGGIVYAFTTANEVKPAIATNTVAASHNAVGFAKSAISAGASGTVNALSGIVKSVARQTGYTATPGDAVYLSATEDGKVTGTAPTTSGQWVVPLGFMVNTTDLMVALGTRTQNA